MSDQKKKPIKAHKGGRSVKIEVRSTPAVKDRLVKIAKFQGISMADIIEQLILKTKI